MDDYNPEMQKKIIDEHKKNGVKFLSTDGVLIHSSVKIEKDVVIYPGTILEEGTTVESGAVLGPNTLIKNSSIGEGSRINASQIYDSKVGKNTNVGPFAHIRPGAEIGNDVKLGNFTEVKKSKIGNNSKVSHLTYVGDSEVGKNVNIGCGSVTVNYDGKNKYKTVINDDVFIGCNNALIAPVEIGKGSFTAAGSTITDNVPENSLAIARQRQVTKIDYLKKDNKDK